MHARTDRDCASQLAEFLEFGCNLTCFVGDGLIREGQDLISKAEEGFCADVLVLLLSPESCPTLAAGAMGARAVQSGKAG